MNARMLVLADVMDRDTDVPPRTAEEAAEIARRTEIYASMVRTGQPLFEASTDDPERRARPSYQPQALGDDCQLSKPHRRRVEDYARVAMFRKLHRRIPPTVDRRIALARAIVGSTPRLRSWRLATRWYIARIPRGRARYGYAS